MAADAETLTRLSGEDQHSSLVTPFMATTVITDKNKLFPIARWAPRSGQNMDYQRFRIGLQRLGKSFGLKPAWIHDAAPPTEGRVGWWALKVVDCLRLAARRKPHNLAFVLSPCESPIRKIESSGNAAFCTCTRFHRGIWPHSMAV